MTKLEKELTIALEMQQEMFIKELNQISRFYQENMSKAKEVLTETILLYQKNMMNAKILMNKQSEELKLYEKASKNIQIRINPEQLNELERKSSERTQHFMEQVQSLKKELSSVATYTEDLERELRKVLSQLNELHQEL